MEALVGGGGRGGAPPGAHGARRWPGVSPGSGLAETATGPGSTLTARGGADSLWLQTVRVFKALQPLDTVELYAPDLCSPIWNMMLAVSHLWLRTAPMSGEEGPSPVK